MQKTKIIEVKERFMAGVDQNTILTIMQDTIDQRDYERLRESLLSYVTPCSILYSPATNYAIDFQHVDSFFCLDNINTLLEFDKKHWDMRSEHLSLIEIPPNLKELIDLMQ
ncbi:MAG: hypothetical protein AABX16_02070, partial [Nanoarchaeota archaeon]